MSRLERRIEGSARARLRFSFFVALAALSCGRSPGDLTRPALSMTSVVVASRDDAVGGVVRERLRAELSNDGDALYGATVVLVSRSADVVLEEAVLRFGAIGAGARAASLDTAAVRRPAGAAFDPSMVSAVIVSFGPDTTVDRTIEAGREAFRHFVDVTNLTAADVGVRAKLLSANPSLRVTDARVDAPRVPSNRRVSTRDLVAFELPAGIVLDPRDVVFGVHVDPGRSGDITGDGRVDVRDVSLVSSCQARDPAQECRCAASDLDADGDVDAGDLSLVRAALGRTQLPVMTPDGVAPNLTITEPVAGGTLAPGSVRVSGFANEPLFSLRVAGVAATVSAVAPYDFAAVVPLGGAGPVSLALTATDLACNDSAVTHDVVVDGGDRVAPVVRLSAPAQATAGAGFRVAVDAQDDHAVTALELRLDGVVVASASGGALVADLVAPDGAGATLALEAVARDAAGNAGSAAASILVVATADTSPPQIVALRVPPTAAPGTGFRAGVDVQDDRGVAEVRFAFGGGAPVVDATPPFEVILDVPAGAAPGSSLTVDVEALDGAGLRANGSASVAIVANADVTSPTGVTLVAPGEASPGGVVPLAATANDDVGVAVMRFLMDGVLVGEDPSAPYEITASVPAGVGLGASVVWTARALDFAGNAADSAPVATRIAAPRTGFIAGEVYDDSTGRPLGDATVSVLEAGGAPPAATMEANTDSRGRYRLAIVAGTARLRISRAGYTALWRDAGVVADAVTTPLDARLSPLGAESSITRRDGGSVALPDGSARVEVGPGALAGDAALALTPLSAQALPAALPLGWSPVVALDVTTGGVPLTAPIAVELADPTAGTASVAIAVRYDLAARAWRRTALEPAAAAGRARVLVDAPTALAIVRADVAPTAPPIPLDGATLSGVSPQSLPPGAAIDLTPSPRIVFAGPSARADVAATLSAGVPSGTRVEVALRESYQRIDGARLDPEGFTEDLLLYAGASGPTAGFVVTPEPTLDALLLREGVVTLDAAPPPPDRVTGILAATGGHLATPGGVALDVLAGALGAPTPVSLESFDPASLGFASDPRFDLVAGASLDLGGAALSSAAVLGLPTPSGVAAGDVLLLLRVAAFGAVSELELVGLAQPVAGGLSVGAGGAGLPFPGVRGEGRFVLARLRVPIAFVTGTLAGASGETILRASTLPFVARASGAPGSGTQYVLASTPGDVTVSALDAASGATVTTVASVVAGAPAALDLALAPGVPHVVSVDPASDATDVGVDVAVRVRFDRPMDPASVDGISITLHAGAALVPAVVALSADRLVATLRPAAALAGETPHALRLAPTLRDAFGGALAGGAPDGSFASGFTTSDITPPPRPAAGQISQSIPFDGTTEILGTVGTAEPGNVVFATNEQTSATVSAIAGADGSFSLQLAAALADNVVLKLRDAKGRETSFDPGPFADPDGTVVVGAAGDVVSGAGGVQAIVPPGAVPDGTPVRVGVLGQADLAVTVPSFTRFVSAIEVEMGNVVAADEIDIALPIPFGVVLDPAKDLLVYAERDFFGTPVIVQINVAHVANDRIETASPPFPGVRRSGKYAVAEGIDPLNSILVLPALVMRIGAAIGSVRTGVDSVFLENFGINDDGSDRAIAIVAIPVSVPFEVTLVNGSPTPVATVPFGPLAGSGLTQIRVGPPDDGSPFEATTILPADQSEEVFIQPVVSVAFNKAVDEPSVLANFRLLDTSISNPAQAGVAGTITLEPVNGEDRIVRFVPDRRLKVGTQYRIQLQGICTFLGAASGGICTDPLVTLNSEFSTFTPRRINGVQLSDANDVSAWDPTVGGAPTDRLLVARGSQQNADATGVVLLDVSEPQAPQVLSETVIASRTLAVLGIDDANITTPDGSKSITGPIALALSGGIEDTSNLRILQPDADRKKLASVGASLITSPNSALLGGLVLADVPPFAGVPRGLAFTPLQGGGAAAFVATVGLGLQSVDLANTLGFIRTQPGLLPRGGALAVASVGNVFALADSRELSIVNTTPTRIGRLNVPAKSLDAVRAFTSDDDANGTIDLPQEQRDLVFVGDELGRFLVVNVTQPTTPTLLASIPLPRRPRDIAVDPNERLAYAATDDGVFVIDVSRPADPSGLAFVDVNADGVDDRILGTIDGIAAARAIDLSRDRTLLYAADPANEQVHVAFVSAGRFYFDPFDPLIPDASLTPTDYYPDLGTKQLTFRGFEKDGSPGEGTVTARVISPAAGVAIPQANMRSGTAILSLTATALLPSQGPIEVELTWTNLALEKQLTRQRFKVRNNSVTTLEEVLAGRAAFVATTHHGADHDGKTPRPPQPISAGYEPTPRPRSLAPVGERKFDFVEEMLNQVGGRKHSAWNNGFRVVRETGIYDSGGQFERSLEIVKTELNIPVNQDAATRTANFRKLMQEYGKTGAVQDSFHHRIVDAETLRMKTLRVQPDRTKPCAPCDVKLNAAATDDTGLYELYTNVVFRFVEDMMARAEAFRDQSAPTNTDGRWVARSGDPVPTRGTDDVVFRNRDDGHHGVSYCYGCKQELETFNTAVSQFLPPDTAEVLASFPNYRGKLIDNVFPGVVDPAGTKMWPGLRQAEQATEAVNTAFRGHFWAGIDCSGFIQRVAWHAARSNPSAGLTRFYAPSGCGNFPTGGAGLCEITTAADGTSEHLNGSASFFDNGRHVHRIQAVGTNFPVHRGDLRVKDGHVAFLYSDPIAPGDSYFVIHAFGGHGATDAVMEGLASNGTARFGRKVGVASWVTHYQNNILGVSRLLLWE